MTTVTIEEAQANLPELIGQLGADEELVITSGARAVAKLVGSGDDKPQPVFGRGRGRLIVLAEDDEHLQGFEEYMP